MTNENVSNSDKTSIWLLIHYFGRENGERSIEHIYRFDTMAMAQAAMNIEVDRFRNNANVKDVLHDRGTDRRHEIDIRSGYNRWYTWEICSI